MQNYQESRFSIDVGFRVNTAHILESVHTTNATLATLPDNLFKAIDYKTTSAMIGAIFCQTPLSLRYRLDLRAGTMVRGN